MKDYSLEHFAEWTKWDERLIHEDNEALLRFEIATTEDQ